MMSDMYVQHSQNLNLNATCTNYMSNDKNKCLHCQRTFSRKGNLQEHLRVHTGEKPFMCTVCNKMFSKSSNLKKHMQTHVGKQCMEPGHAMAINSGYQFQCTQYPQVTRQVSAGEKRFKCTFCGKGYTRNFYLTQHTAKKHKDREPLRYSRETQTEDSYFRGESAKQPVNYQHKCPQCEKLFARKGNLQEHLRVHTGERPFPCTQCDKTFTRKNYLKIHYRVHEEELNKLCSYSALCETATAVVNMTNAENCQMN